MLRRKGPLYRIIAIVAAFLILGCAIFLPLAAQNDAGSRLIMYIFMGVWGAALIATIVITEIYYFRRRKKDESSD